MPHCNNFAFHFLSLHYLKVCYCNFCQTLSVRENENKWKKKNRKKKRVPSGSARVLGRAITNNDESRIAYFSA